MKLLRTLVIRWIARYQRHGGGIEQFRVDCNFEPSCSEYAKQAVGRYGVLRGSQLALKRIRRCCDRDQVNKISDPLPAGQSSRHSA